MDRAITQDIMRRANVVSVGLGEKAPGELGIVVGVTRKMPLSALAAQDVIPTQYEGLRTDVIELGTIRAFDRVPDQFSVNRERPALGGDSIGHHQITAGTLGCIVRKNGVRMILSNNHVMANSNDAQIGDPIYQPGPHDGGMSIDTIAHLEDFVPITFAGGVPSECPIGGVVARSLNLVARLFRRKTRMIAVQPQLGMNLVDAAIARPLTDLMVSDEIRDIGSITGVADVHIGMPLVKRGRTTDTTFSVVNQVDVTVQVQYGPGQLAIFEDQVLTGPMSQPGDSGSAVLSDPDHRLVGLLFAGSDQVTIFSPIHHVMDALGVTL